MQILSLFLCLSVCLSVSLSKYFFLTLQTRYCIDPPPLKTEEGFRAPPASTPHVVLGSVLAKPQAGRKWPSLPTPLGREHTTRPFLQTPQESRFCTFPPPFPAPSSLCLPSPPPPISAPPQALGFSFVKCGLKIIFGKLTPLPLPFPPPSKKHEHLEEQPPERGGCRAVAWQMQQKWLVCVIWKEKKKKKPHMFSMGKMKAWVLSSTSASFRSLFPRADLAVMGWLGTRRALTGACHPFPPPETR